MAFKAFVFLLLALLLFTTGSSTKAPAHAPEKPPMAFHPPEKAPIAEPPVKPIYECVEPCEEHCKDHQKKRPCMKSCTACCKKCNKCVPLGTSKCSDWDYVLIHGERVACP
ncbi:gibberellin-regulated protein 2-like isoform X2 [Rhodamnia argentea]|uniref:Gibberellin-regulated protein 2-like isoform X2 n=1 Tax=Rhodamnia argentea TaxID=178133 RepID=A0A8B8P8V2_9MYRT|nr:gibberellin-regulated protein 2-like isoform X2 [Rhodamnia argentea]